MPAHCRYYPTCSSYTLQAMRRFGNVRGIIMGFFRILRCQPFVKGGYDPVPKHFSIHRNRQAEQQYRQRMHL